MKTYAKGARSERELLHYLNGNGFSVIRTASSGGFITPVDVVAMKRGLVLAFECKAWEHKPKLEPRKADKFLDWCRQAGALGFLAWRTKNKWLFLRAEDARQGRYDDEHWIELEQIMKVFG